MGGGGLPKKLAFSPFPKHIQEEEKPGRGQQHVRTNVAGQKKRRVTTAGRKSNQRGGIPMLGLDTEKEKHELPRSSDSCIRLLGKKSSPRVTACMHAALGVRF